jgi:hypothetical protein
MELPLVLRRTTKIDSPAVMMVVGAGFVGAMMAAFMLKPLPGISIATGLVVVALIVRSALRKSTITVTADAVTEKSFGHTRTVRLADVQSYRFVAADPNARMIEQGGGKRGGMLVVALAKLESGDPQHQKLLTGHLALRGRDGSTVEISAPYARATEAIDYLVPRLHEHLGPGAGAALPGPMDRVEISRDGRVHVMHAGKVQQSIDLGTIDNSLLVLEQLLAQRIKLDVASQVFLPVSVRTPYLRQHIAT